MLQSQRQNMHHSKLPIVGDIGHIDMCRHDLRANRYMDREILAARKCIVSHYPLTDSAIYHGRPMSRGIHTIYVRFLDNGEIRQFSAMWFISDRFGA